MRECTQLPDVLVFLLYSRHCGRILCAKCSEKDMPIIKYNIVKPVRICDICFNVLTHGTV